MQDSRRRRLGERIVRRARIRPVRIDLTLRRPSPPKRISPLILVYGFALLIGIGTLLLLLPAANKAGGFTPFVTAFFTATSAVTVTGLVVVDTSSYWSPFGLGVILALIQIGGLGIMTLSTLLFILLGRRITLRERLAIREAAGLTVLGGVVRLVRQIGLLILVLEGVGMVALTIRFAFDLPFPSALWNGLFHAVSAFNNAGFAVLPGAGLPAYRNDASVLLIMAVLVILGGISITVINDLMAKRRFGRLALDSKMVLTASLLLWLSGILVFFVSEYANPDSLGPLGVPGKLLNSFFASVNARTAGFASLSVPAFYEYTLFFLLGLMFIGGASGSTAGGIKVNTFGVVLASVVAAVRGKPNVEAFKRELPNDQVFRALAIVVLGLGVVFLIAFLLNVVEEKRFIDLFFETVSAFGSVGNSSGVTSGLSVAGQLLIMLAMFVGKFGPLTLVLALAQRPDPGMYRYAQERVKIG